MYLGICAFVVVVVYTEEYPLLSYSHLFLI